MPFQIVQEFFDGEVLVIQPKVFPDHRGFFMELYRTDLFAQMGLSATFVQDNRSRSHRNVIRGLHFQWDPPMGKLMWVSRGKAFLVAVDIRPDSPTAGKWVAIHASEDNHLMMWAPPWFARGFLALADITEVQYKCTAIYNPQGEGSIRWNDPAIGIDWPLNGTPILSEKDQNAMTLAEWFAHPAAQTFAYARTRTTSTQPHEPPTAS